MCSLELEKCQREKGFEGLGGQQESNAARVLRKHPRPAPFTNTEDMDKRVLVPDVARESTAGIPKAVIKCLVTKGLATRV